MESSTASATTVPASPLHVGANGEVALPAVEAAPEGEPQLEPCPVQESIKIVGRKWHLIILWELSKAPLGFNELKAATRGISGKMLSQSLSDLETNGLVERDVVTKRPLRVSYRLSDKGVELTGVFRMLHDWGTRHGLCSTDAGASNSGHP